MSIFLSVIEMLWWLARTLLTPKCTENLALLLQILASYLEVGCVFHVEGLVPMLKVSTGDEEVWGIER